MIDILFLISGIILLYLGAEGVVRGTGRISAALGIRALTISLTVIAFGTSLPEFATSIAAAIRKEGEIAMGNVLGSNIANIGLIVGLSSLLRPLKVEKSLLRKDIIFMFLTYLLLLVLSIDLYLSRLDGILLFLCLFFFIFSELREGVEKRGGRKTKGLLLLFGGLISTCLGAHLMVEGGVGLARAIGVSEFVIGLSIIAFGTSLPELAVSLIASVKRRGDISLGNVIGSNIFNVLGILGLVSIILPLKIDKSLLFFHYPALFGFGLLLLLFMRSGKIGRWGGFISVHLYDHFIWRIF